MLRARELPAAEKAVEEARQRMAGAEKAAAVEQQRSQERVEKELAAGASPVAGGARGARARHV